MPHKEWKSNPSEQIYLNTEPLPTQTNTDTQPDTPEVIPGSQQIIGLCVNCEHRLTCRHCKQLGGVWFCEEYE